MDLLWFYWIRNIFAALIQCDQYYLNKPPSVMCLQIRQLPLTLVPWLYCRDWYLQLFTFTNPGMFAVCVNIHITLLVRRAASPFYPEHGIPTFWSKSGRTDIFMVRDKLENLFLIKDSKPENLTNIRIKVVNFCSSSLHTNIVIPPKWQVTGILNLPKFNTQLAKVCRMHSHENSP